MLSVGWERSGWRQTLAIKSTEGPEAGGTGVSVEEGVETNEAHKKSEDGKSAVNNRLETSEEVGTRS